MPMIDEKNWKSLDSAGSGSERRAKIAKFLTGFLGCQVRLSDGGDEEYITIEKDGQTIRITCAGNKYDGGWACLDGKR